MGLRTGTPDAEATITTRSARLDLGSRVDGRRSPKGTADGVAAWVRHCCAQWEAGAREGRSIAEAR